MNDGLLRLSTLGHLTGRGVRVAIIDSGVHAIHPHVRGVAGGVGIDPAGKLHADFVDRLGHGTAVTAAIKEKAPAADLFVIKIFDRELKASADALVSGIRRAIAHGAHLINLSLGTDNADHEVPLAAAVGEACAAGASIIAAAPHADIRWLPGALRGVVAVDLDWELARDVCAVAVDGDGVRLRASGYPRPIPGVAPENNLKGISFAVANATGLIARAMEGQTSTPLVDVLRAVLSGNG